LDEVDTTFQVIEIGAVEFISSLGLMVAVIIRSTQDEMLALAVNRM